MDKIEFIRKAFDYINLESELDDFDKIHESIEKDLVFKGTNLWILVFAIIVASVGLNMNSTAVIIGAMLISPLMGPINGMGYGVATYNFPLFKKAVKNFTFAVVASLLASSAYFLISPISTAHSELLARTSPTIYDVLIALFGGLAGIVAISSRQKGNVIPGVAIATALMPPLCTAGYGLATGQLYYFFGAFYLFTINTVFIAISSVVISQILKFPIRTIVDTAQKKRVNKWISAIISLVLIPSIYFGYNLVQKETFIENASRYVSNVNIVEGNFLLKHDINADTKTISLIYGGATLGEAQKENIRDKAKDFSLNNATINFEQGLDFDDFARRSNEVDNLKLEVNRQNLLVREKEAIIDSLVQRTAIGREIFDEIKALYPDIVGCSFADSHTFHDDLLAPQSQKVIIFQTAKKAKEPLKPADRNKIEGWLSIRLKSDNVKVIYE